MKRYTKEHLNLMVDKIVEAKKNGVKYVDLAEQLNNANILTANGLQWNADYIASFVGHYKSKVLRKLSSSGVVLKIGTETYPVVNQNITKLNEQSISLQTIISILIDQALSNDQRVKMFVAYVSV